MCKVHCFVSAPNFQGKSLMLCLNAKRSGRDNYESLMWDEFVVVVAGVDPLRFDERQAGIIRQRLMIDEKEANTACNMYTYV